MPSQRGRDKIAATAASIRACRDPRGCQDSLIVFSSCLAGSQEFLGGEWSWGEGSARSARLVCNIERMPAVSGKARSEPGNTKERSGAAVVCATTALTH